MSDLIRYQVRDRVAVLTVDNPPVNALGPGVLEGIEAAVARASADPDVDAMVLVGAGATVPIVIQALGRVALSVLAALVGSVLLLRLLPQLPFGRRLILDTGMTAGLGWVSAPESDHQWLGRSGTATSPLRPAGIATIGGQRLDVVSDGAFIEAGAPVVVTRVDGNRIVVSLEKTNV